MMQQTSERHDRELFEQPPVDDRDPSDPPAAQEGPLTAAPVVVSPATADPESEPSTFGGADPDGLPVTPVAGAPVAAPPPAPAAFAPDPLDEAPEHPEAGNVARPEGITPSAIGVDPSDPDASVPVALLKVRGSVIDGGSAQDLLDGKHPRPSVESQREIDQFNRIRAAGLDLRRPVPWPEFMPYPTDEELRLLSQEHVTREMMDGFEEAKQRLADLMVVRAEEINDWIFRSGTMKLNEEAQMRRARNRDVALQRMDAGSKKNFHKPGADRSAVEPTQDQLYGDPFFGIKFACLLNPDPEHLNKMRQAPVTSWGHDQLITMDGGRLRLREGEIIVTSVSLQAAQMLVMEAKARGWETLRVSGDNEFCAAVKRAAKEVGLGAIIHRRGPLGIGPFSRPEVIMPAIPRTRIPEGMEPPVSKERQEREDSAPAADAEAANALDPTALDPTAKLRAGPRSTKPKRDAGVDVFDPLEKPSGPAPDAPDPGPN